VSFIQLCQARSGCRAGFLFWAANPSVWLYIPAIQVDFLVHPEVPHALPGQFAFLAELVYPLPRYSQVRRGLA
jgi:hypothetical protein